ncbi:MAG: TRAP transporter permease [Thermodesulfobacteriota bacterium]
MGQGSGLKKQHILFAGGLLFAIIQLVVPVYAHLIDLQLRSIHVGLGLSLALLAFPFRKAVEREKLSWWDLVLIGVVVASNVNILLKTMDIYTNPGGGASLDLILGIALLVLLMETTRRTVGWIIPGILVLLIIYIFVAPWMPGIWKMRGLSWQFLINSVYYSPLGIYGTVTGMSATFIAMFVILGALFVVTGAGKTFIDLAVALTGRFTGGPAKTSVVSSAMFGMISGSSVANVMVDGWLTIPMMKKLGYDPNFAGAVEAIASTGGGITPPIMSITAFMMAEFLNISYLRIIGYALVPCILFYTGVFSGIHFWAVRKKLSGLPREEIPLWKEILTWRKMGIFIIPIGVLLVSIYTGRPLIYAAYDTCLASILIYFVINFRSLGFKKICLEIIQGFSTGGVDVARLVPVLVSVGVLVNLIGIAGLAPKISSLILEIGSENLYLSLLIATIIPFILGTALPVVPTYLLSLSILIPILLKLGVDEVAAHLFFIYWGVLGAVTPPTCEAAVVAAGIAKGDWLKTGFLSMKLGAVAFFLPYFFVLNPALVGRSGTLDVLVAAITGFFGAIAMAYGLFGWIKNRLNLLIRFLFFAGGLMLLFPEHTTSLVGLGVVLVAFAGERMVKKSLPLSS